MSAPDPKDGDGGSPPAPGTGSHKIVLPDEDEPLIVLDAEVTPIPPSEPRVKPPPPPPPAKGAGVPAIIDDIPADKPPAPRAQPEHTTEPPSIASDRVREPISWAATEPAEPARPPSPWPRRVLLI